MNKVKEALISVRALISRGWTQRTYARDAFGNGVPLDSPEATCWCTLGAIALVGQDISNETWNAMQNHFIAVNFIPSVAAWNDAETQTQACVLHAFDKAIAKLS